MLCQIGDVRLLSTILEDLEKLVEACDDKISGQVFGFVNVDVRKVSSKLGNQIVGRFIELVDAVMQVLSTSSDFDPFGPIR